MYLIQILLPRPSPDTPADDGRFARTRTELVEKFDGVTAYLRAPAQGIWTGPDGHRELDDMVMIEVMAPGFERTWWRHYGDELARRFDQRVIMIRALAIETP